MSSMIQWNGVSVIPSREYICGHCDSKVRVARGYHATYKMMSGHPGLIYVCSCEHPTYFSMMMGEDQKQIPMSLLGKPVEELPGDVQTLYTEARRSVSSGSYTACELLCRKILMNTAVNKGAETNKKFFFYVNYIEEKNLFPAGCKAFVEEIKNAGNEANHEIHLSSKESAELTLEFTEALLKCVYEYPNLAQKKLDAKKK